MMQIRIAWSRRLLAVRRAKSWPRPSQPADTESPAESAVPSTADDPAPSPEGADVEQAPDAATSQDTVDSGQASAPTTDLVEEVPQATNSSVAPPRVLLDSVASEAALPAGMTVVGGSPHTDDLYVSWSLPSAFRTGCDEGQHSLFSIDSNARPSQNRTLAPSFEMVDGPSRRVVVTTLCDGRIQSLEAGRYGIDGTLDLDGALRAPQGFFFSQFAPVWSATGNELLVHVQDATGVLWLASYRLANPGDQWVESGVVAATGQVVGSLPNDRIVLATSRSVAVDGQPVLWLNPEIGTRGVAVKTSLDGQRIALATENKIVIVDQDGVVDESEVDGEILELAWSPTGQLLFSVEGAPALRYYDSMDETPFGTAFVAPGSWRQMHFSDKGRSIALTGSADGVSTSRIVRLQDALFVVGSTGRCAEMLLVGDSNSPRFTVAPAPEGEPPGFASIAQVEVGVDGRTISGVKIGSRQDEVFTAYGERIESLAAPAGSAERDSLVFVPATEEDGSYRLIMELNEGEVSGFTPEAVATICGG